MVEHAVRAYPPRMPKQMRVTLHADVGVPYRLLGSHAGISSRHDLAGPKRMVEERVNRWLAEDIAGRASCDPGLAGWQRPPGGTCVH
jgi:hypothetical protein